MAKLQPEDPSPATGSVGFEVTFWIEPRHREEFLQTAAILTHEVRPDCPTCPTCFEKIGGESRFLWRECWESRAALEGRLRSAEVRTLLGAIEVLGRLDRMQAIELRDQPLKEPGRSK